MISTKMNDDKAASEAIGYITLFGTIILALGIVYLNAGPVLQNTQDAQNMQAAEGVFLLLQQNVGDITQQDAPVREVGLDLQESSVGIGDDDMTWVNVSIDGRTFNHSIDRVYYEKVDQRVVYENAAVIRVSGEQSAMLSEPDWLVQNETVIVGTVATRGGGSVAGTEGVRIVVRESVSETNTYLDADFNVTVNSRYLGPWETYFRDLNESVDGEVTVSGSAVSLEVEDVDNVVYSEHTLNARLET